MQVTPFLALSCPLDYAPLQREQQRWCCENGHSFDVARQGHVNLLPVQQKRSRDPGDSKEMIAARQAFLAAGYFSPIADQITRRVLSRHQDDVFACLDAGAGEGYYLRELAEAARSSGGAGRLSMIGLDISKWAMLAAARLSRDITWVVGTNAHLPVQSGTLDWVFCLFGFPVYTEFQRVLKPGGCILRVDPGPDHLRELREILYPRLKGTGEARVQVPGGFTMDDSQPLTNQFTLPDPTAIHNLLAMTPHMYRAPAAGKAKAQSLASLALTLDVTVTVLKKQ